MRLGKRYSVLVLERANLYDDYTRSNWQFWKYIRAGHPLVQVQISLLKMCLCWQRLDGDSLGYATVLNAAH
jgi:hypothetical protein